MNAQKFLAFLYTNNEKSENEVKETRPFTIATKTYMKRCSASLIIRKMQIKTTIRCHLTWSGWPLPKKENLQTISAGESVEKREPF